MKSVRRLLSVRIFLICMWVTPGVLSLGNTETATASTGTGFVFLSDAADGVNSLANAIAKCHEVNQRAGVLEIADDSEKITVTGLIAASSHSFGGFWLGLQDVWDESDFFSLRSGQTLTYTVWKDGFPKTDTAKNCAKMLQDEWTWEETECTNNALGVLCSISANITTTKPDCPFPGALNDDSCYDSPSSNDHNFDAAKDLCHAQGKRVPVPFTEDDYKSLVLYANLFSLDKVWLGISDEAQEAVFVSVYGDYTRTLYTESSGTMPWTDGEPKVDSTRNCAVLRTDGRYDDKDCNNNNNKQVICQVPADCPFPGVLTDDSCYDSPDSSDHYFDVAKDLCHAQGKRLPVPYTEDHYKSLVLYADLFNLNEVWLGISDEAQDSVFVSVYGDDKPINTPTWNMKWKGGGPESHSDHSCAILKDNLYEDKDCSHDKKVICQIPAGCPFPGVLSDYSCYDSPDSVGRDFADAKALCDAEGKRLPVPYTQDDYDSLVLYANLFNLDNVWLGIRDDAENGVFVSEYGNDTRTLYTVSGPPWKDDQRTHDNENCAVLKNDLYEDKQCTDNKKVICQVPAGCPFPGVLSDYSCYDSPDSVDRDFADAKALCDAEGKRLPVPYTQDDYDSLVLYANLFNLDKVWLGIVRDDAASGAFVSVYGNDTRTLYTVWRSGSTNLGEKCAALRGVEYEDWPCIPPTNYKCKVICQVPADLQRLVPTGGSDVMSWSTGEAWTVLHHVTAHRRKEVVRTIEEKSWRRSHVFEWSHTYHLSAGRHQDFNFQFQLIFDLKNEIILTIICEIHVKYII